MFCAVAETGSLAPAAARLHLTPSALSHGLKSLETELGCRLFDRAGKKMLLNQAGEQLLGRIRPALAALEEAAESVKRLGKWGQVRLRVAAAASICQHLLPAVIRELKKSLDRLELQVESGDTTEVMEMVRARKVELALGIAPESHAGLEVRPLFRDELMLVFAPSHPWAAGGPISSDDLRKQPLILYQRSSATARLFDGFFEDLKVVPSTIMEIGNIEAIKELVRLNLGVSVLAPWAVHKELARGSLKMRPLGSKPLRRNWVVLSLAGHRLTLTEESFCKLCRQQTAAMRLDRKDVPPLKG
ncbi:MAG TPA: LysR family transcriptional regulator [Candidatus Binatia bacterium]|nr:LysR family transcriptional regulator [Candidatus Binatia bacterium]